MEREVQWLAPSGEAIEARQREGQRKKSERVYEREREREGSCFSVHLHVFTVQDASEGDLYQCVGVLF